LDSRLIEEGGNCWEELAIRFGQSDAHEEFSAMRRRRRRRRIIIMKKGNTITNSVLNRLSG